MSLIFVYLYCSFLTFVFLIVVKLIKRAIISPFFCFYMFYNIYFFQKKMQMLHIISYQIAKYRLSLLYKN